jgi:pimeloyl-ACP methyl ester carboxylesterase/DNA-binding transcriptional LysR family regulator/AraC-like DNA-binding protein
VDALDQILSSLRLTGGVVIDADLTGDFCLLAQFTPDHCAPFFPVPDTLISYHYVRSGRVIVEIDGQPPVTLGPGSIAILPRNDPHLLARRSGLRPADVSEIAWVTADGVHKVASGTPGEKVEIWCGFLGTAKSNAHPLLEALPALLTLDATGGDSQWLESSMRFLAQQGASPELVARLAEVFLAQAIRDYVDRLAPGSKGWLRGLADPAVSKALSIIHTRYAEEIDIESLAREAGVSRTVLGERFSELIGEPPMRYCARWRMRIAANMLRDGKQGMGNIAYAVGFNSEAAFNRAFKREYGIPPATWRRRAEAEEQAAANAAKRQVLPPQQVRYCAAADGTKLAYSVTGSGPPLVKTANWLNHIQHDWDSPLWRHWIEEFTHGHSLIRYDERGNGLSDWDTPELSFDAFVDDLETVVDELKLEQFDLLAISQGAAVAVAYAVRHPERVRRLVVINGYAAGWAVRADAAELARREAMLTLTEVGWGADNSAYRQLFTNIYVPEATPKQMGWFNEMQRLSASPENAVRLQRVLSAIDVRELLPKVQVPTLIFHSRNDQAVPFAQGAELAAGIPNAQFIALESRNHILLESEPAWQEFAGKTREFLDSKSAPRPIPAQPREPEPLDRKGETQGPDGARIAYASSGEGFPLVKAPTWMTHLDHDWTCPVYEHWLREGVRANRLIRSDMRGFGLSEWEPPEFDFETMVGDLATVIDAAEVEQCDLLGMSHGAAIAIAYAARNPERVRKLVLVNSFAAGWRVRNDPEEIAWRESLLEMNRRQPSFRRSLLGEMFITLYFPSASQHLIDWHNELFQTLGPVPNMNRMIELASWIDVRDELRKVKAPTLVCHASHDMNAPLAAGRQVADGIAGARLVELDSANHIMLGDEAAWPVLVRELRGFLGTEGMAASAAHSAQRPSPPPVDPRPKQLVVSGTPTAINWLTRHIGSFLEANPDLSVQLDPEIALTTFDRDGVDCAVRCGLNRPTGLHVDDLFQVDFTPMCSPAFLADHPEIRTPAGLFAAPRITPTDPWWEWLADKLGIDDPQGQSRGVQMGAQVLDGQAAMRGQGVALLTPFFWREEMEEGRLVSPIPDLVDDGGAYWLIYPRDRTEWQKIQRFSEWLRALCVDTSIAAQTAPMPSPA